MDEEDFDIPCSDDELSHIKNWEPPAEEIIRLYNILDKNEIPPLQWKCPGYRPPTPEAKEQIDEFKDDEEEHQVENKSDFDFMDEVTSPTLKIRKDGEDALKGSAKKKTTSLDGVISNMRRHNLLSSAQKLNYQDKSK